MMLDTQLKTDTASRIKEHQVFAFELANSPTGRKPASRCQLSAVRCSSRGVATLPTVILISIMALVIAVGLASLSFTELMVSQGSSQSSRALFYAEAGARDALIRIARDKNFATSSYAVDFTTGGTGCSPTWGGCATVSVSSGSPKIATSTGAMGASSRTLSVSVTLDANGTITGTTWSEATN